MPEEEHLRSIFLKQQAKAREKYEKLIALWNSGVTEASKLAEPLNTTRLGACSMIAAAKRWELISDYPLQTYK